MHNQERPFLKKAASVITIYKIKEDFTEWKLLSTLNKTISTLMQINLKKVVSWTFFLSTLIFQQVLTAKQPIKY